MSQKHTQLCHRSRLVQEILAATHDGHERVRLVRDTVSHLGVFLVSHFHLALVHHDALQIEEATLESNVGERALRFAHVTVVDDLLLLLLLLPVIHGRRLRLDRGLLRLPLHLLLPHLARGRVVLWVGQVVELRWIGLEEHHRLRLVDFELAAGAVVLRAVDRDGGLGCRSGPTA